MPLIILFGNKRHVSLSEFILYLYHFFIYSIPLSITIIVLDSFFVIQHLCQTQSICIQEILETFPESSCVCVLDYEWHIVNHSSLGFHHLVEELSVKVSILLDHINCLEHAEKRAFVRACVLQFPSVNPKLFSWIICARFCALFKCVTRKSSYASDHLR